MSEPVSPERAYFGTDGIRGPVGGPVVNEVFFREVGAAAARWLATQGVRTGRVLLARDTRSSGEALSRALASGVVQEGLQPVLLGVLPTPVLSRALGTEGAVLGAVVTASHNPAGDNGVKFFGADGAKVSDAAEAAIESLLKVSSGSGILVGEVDKAASSRILGAYVQAAAKLLPERALEGWTLVLDTANGAACVSSARVLAQLGATLERIGDSPDGTNINAGVGSEHPQALAARVLAAGAQVGIAHDGDGDRCVLCDEKGLILDGDEILAILATEALGRGALAARTLVVTVQSNLGLDEAVRAAGGRVLRTGIGDRAVAERMRATGATLGGESSGHIVGLDFAPTGDGLAAALQVLRVMHETGRPLSELRRVMRKFPQRVRNLTVRAKPPLESLPSLPAVLREVEAHLGERGRVLVRYSGTEPKLRLLVEGPTEESVGSAMERLYAAARADLGSA